MGGVVVSPTAVRLLCAYSTDGGTQGEDKACPIARVPDGSQINGVWWRGSTTCVPGCSVQGEVPQWCTGPEDWSGCRWRPNQLEQMMSQHATRLQRGGQLKYRHNEVVFDSAEWMRELPRTIEAFFVQPGMTDEEVAKVVAAHSLYVRELRAPRTPLLTYTGAGFEMHR